MKLDYEEITKYHKAGLLDSMRMSLGIPWEDIVTTLLDHQSSDMGDTIDELTDDLRDAYDELRVVQNELQMRSDELLRLQKKLMHLESRAGDVKNSTEYLDDMFSQLPRED
jgi:hypothetical protein